MPSAAAYACLGLTQGQNGALRAVAKGAFGEQKIYVHQDRPYSARIQPRFKTLQIKLKLVHNVCRDMPNPQSKSFSGTPSRQPFDLQRSAKGT